MSEKKIKIRQRDYKKIILIILIIIVSLAFIGTIYAVVSKIYKASHKITSGTVVIENTNLQIEEKLTGTMTNKIKSWAPGDANILTWNTNNIGTAAIKTKHTIQVFWNNSDINSNSNELMYFYPSNMTNEEILADYKAEKSKAIQIDKETKIVVDGKEKVGVSYSFYGDILDGTERTGVAKEVNYDISDVSTELFTTKENEAKSDKIAFRIFLSPDTSYLYQEEKLSIRILTEAVQYTENGKENWTLQSVQELN